MKVGPRNAMVIAVVSARHRGRRGARRGAGRRSAPRGPPCRARRRLRSTSRRAAPSSVAEAASPIDDVRGTAAYRRHALRVLDRPRARERASHEDQPDGQRRAAARPRSGRARACSSSLRERLGLPGSKNACEQGECGSCSVLLDGDARLRVSRPRRAGRRPPRRHRRGAGGATGSCTACRRRSPRPAPSQCGFCTPGLIVATADLLAAHARARARTRSARRSPATSAAAPATRRSSTPSGSRRAGERLTRASRARARPDRREPSSAVDAIAEGDRRVRLRERPRSRPGCSGATPCAARTRTPGSSRSTSRRRWRWPASTPCSRTPTFPGAKTVRARVRRPAGARDRPRPLLRRAGRASSPPSTPSRRARAAEQIVVEYEPLEPVVDPERATEQAADPRRNPTAGHGYREDPRPNVVRSIVIRHGDPDAQGDVSVERRLRARASRTQAFLGPESGSPVPDGEGGVDVYVATQWLHVDRDQVAPCLGLEKEQVRIHLAGRRRRVRRARGLSSMQIHGAMLALHTDRPVKMVYSREESFVGHVHRHPAKIWMEHRATRDGQARAASARGSCSTAARTPPAPRPSPRTRPPFACGPYKVDERADRVAPASTRTTRPAARCAASAPCRAASLHEAQMDKLAAALDIDPDRAAAAERARPGRHDAHGPGRDRLAAGRRGDPARRGAAGARAGGAAARPDPPARAAPGNTTRGQGVKRGVGFAVGFKNVCYSEGFDDCVLGARAPLDRLGRGARRRGALRRGRGRARGVTDVILQVARTELGTENVALAPGSTDGVDSAGSASASRLTWMAAGRGAARLPGRRWRSSGAPGGEVDLERTYRHSRTFPLDPETGQVTGDRVHVAYICARDARRRRGRRRARPDARRLDRRRPGRRQGAQPAGRPRARSRAAPRRASGSR